MKFQGDSFTNKRGNYIGKLDLEELHLLRGQVDKVNWKELKEIYSIGKTDTQHFNVEMVDQMGRRYRLTTDSPKSKSVNILIFHAFKIVEDSQLEKTEEVLEFSTVLRFDR